MMRMTKGRKASTGSFDFVAIETLPWEKCRKSLFPEVTPDDEPNRTDISSDGEKLDRMDQYASVGP